MKPGSKRYAAFLLKQLRERRKGILQRVQRNGDAVQATPSPDSGDAATEIAELEVASRLSAADSALLHAIDGAVKRLVVRPDTAGVCQSEHCVGNGVIEEERFECFPETGICSACARKAERSVVAGAKYRGSGPFGGRRRGQ